jgi:hypothetical protein
MTFETASEQLAEIGKKGNSNRGGVDAYRADQTAGREKCPVASINHKIAVEPQEAQYPALPSTDDELEDFAAGMAMGFDILSVLEQRDEQGVHVDKELFLAGIKETIRGERRLSQEDFERHLKRANQRVEDAMHKIESKRKRVMANGWRNLSKRKALRLPVIRPGIKSFMRVNSRSRMRTLKER